MLVVKDKSKTTGKIKKTIDLGIEILQLDELK